MSASQGPTVRVTGGEAVARALAANGADVVFGIPGTHTLAVHGHLARYGIRHVGVRHEQAAGYAADAYARVTGRPGVALVTSGPGVLNLASAMAQAYSDSVPVLVVSAAPRRRGAGVYRGLLHEAKDQRAACAALVAQSYRPVRAEEVDEMIALAFASMRAGRPRPVHVEVPADVLEAEGEVPERPTLAPLIAPRSPDEAAVEAAAAALSGARHVGIVLGGGAWGCGRRAEELAEATGALVVTSANGKGILDERHPRCLGAGLHLRAVQRWLARCDVVLAVGTELAETDFWGVPPRLGGTLVRLDADPEQMVRGQRADVALVGDAARGLFALLERLGRRRGEGAAGPRALDPEAASVVAEVRAEGRLLGARWLSALEEIAAALGPEAVVASDTSMVCYNGALANLRLGQGSRFLHPTGFATLGYALPAAIGAAVACPDRPVLALCGDGAFQFSLQEVATAASLRRPLPVVVFDNGGYGEIREEMASRGFVPQDVDVRLPDLVLLAAAYGQAGARVASAGDLGRELRAAFGRPQVSLIGVEEER
jgi:5-guanidino-2-oxopentanoate decarboxylase